MKVDLENVTYRKKSNGEIDYNSWIDLSGLPKVEKGTNKGKINWQKSVGYKVNFKYDDVVGIIDILDYSASELSIVFNETNFRIVVGNLVKVKLGKLLNKHTSNFKVGVGEIFNNGNDNLTVIDRYIVKTNNMKNENRKFYKYKCNKCGFIGSMLEGSLLSNVGCSCCNGKTVVEGINDIATTAPWMVKYLANPEDSKKYTPSSNKKINVKCPDCCKSKKVVIYNLYKNKSIGCICGDGVSYLSKYIYSVLNQLNLNFETEVKYDWNKYINPKNNKLTQASIDFVIYHDGKEIPLEADGEFHRMDNKVSNDKIYIQKSIDKQRDKNCLKYLNEKTIRITNEGDIKCNILNSRLGKLFDLNSIDWDKCNEFAMSSLIMKVCEYWNNKEEWETTKDLAKVFKMSRTTIINYLKKGNSNYNPKEEMKNNGVNNSGLHCKKVEMFKDGISLGIFDSASILSENSMNMFGIKLTRSKISSVAIGKQVHHKGFTFKYVDTNKEEIA